MVTHHLIGPDLPIRLVSTIERILILYKLPLDLCSFSLGSMESIPMEVEKRAKLCTLFDFLGASGLADQERMKAERWKRDMVVITF